MRPFHLLTALSIIACAALVPLAGCGSFSRFGPAAQNVVPAPTTLVNPSPGSIPISDATVGTLPGSSSPVVILGAPVPNNTILVPALNYDYVWDQIVDVVDDYFQIDQEDRVKLVGAVQTEGRIDTFPIPGATLLEPWRRDSVNFHERLESTLQSIRRRSFVRVIPQENGCAGYVVEVTVTKELEDVPHPINGSAGASTFRYDTSLNRDTEFDTDPARIPGDPARPIGPRAATGGWIPLAPDGRDHGLEQVILAKIQARLGGVPSVPGPTLPAEPIATPVTLPPGAISPQPMPRVSQFPPGAFQSTPPGGILQPQELPSPQ
ncbi:MAG TPA: hypothetical protein VFE46_17455 [Pirellulales bacterium]|jgi:hypothetical protein|nr:hypothetical protein [Pirellulales bacterium]